MTRIVVSTLVKFIQILNAKFGKFFDPQSMRNNMEEPDYFLKFCYYYDKLPKLKLELYNFIDLTELNERFDKAEELKVARKVRDNIIELEKKMDKAKRIITAKDSKSFNKQFERMIGPFADFSIYYYNSIKILSSLKENYEENETKITELVENLKNLNNGLEELLNFPEWKKNFKIKVQSFESSLPDPSTSQGQYYSDYLNIARNFDRNDATYKSIVKSLDDLCSDVFLKKDDGGYKFKKPRRKHSYAATVGPSFMGKTQLAFNLAAERPVFYTNFAYESGYQEVYEAFQPISEHIRKNLESDYKSLDKLKSKKKENQKMDQANKKKRPRKETNTYESCVETEFLFENRNLKLKIVGFIWKLVEYSVTFNFNDSNDDWFNYYLKDRTVLYESLSIDEFHANMSKTRYFIIFYLVFNVENLVETTQNFRIPIIFIDELTKRYIDSIKLLRNIAHCLVLPCMLSSTNATVNNMLNIGSPSSRSVDYYWVSAAIRTSKVYVSSICKNLKVTEDFVLEKYLSPDLKTFLTVSGSEREFKILSDLNITSVSVERVKLTKLWKLLLDQSETGLQGIVSQAFLNLIESLKSSLGSQLNVKSIWVSICDDLSGRIFKRKMNAFHNNGPYYSLRMFSTEKTLSAKSEQKGNNFIEKSIDRHFYYFGSRDDPVTLNLDYDGRELYFNRNPYDLCSHFLPFDRNILLNMGIWKNNCNKTSIASIVAKHRKHISDALPNIHAKSNDFRAQETMSYWAIANCKASSERLKDMNLFPI